MLSIGSLTHGVVDGSEASWRTLLGLFFNVKLAHFVGTRLKKRIIFAAVPRVGVNGYSKGWACAFPEAPGEKSVVFF